MSFLHLLENIRVPVLNELMLGITYLGDEIAFLVVSLIVFWCVDKLQGYYILSVGFFGTITNQFMKLWFRIPRPWVKDESFTILEQAREGATGYSFPSGHTQNAVGTFGGIAYTTKNKTVRILAILIAVLVPFSRMYVGVHTPLDVTVAAVIALALIFLLKPVVMKEDGKYIPVLLGVMVVFAIAFLCFVTFYEFPADVDTANLASGIQSAYMLLGALLGMVVVHVVDNLWIHFPTKAVWWAQILKVLGGLILVIGVKSGTKTILNSLFGEYIGRAVRYFLIVIVAGVVWPMTFKWFSGLGRKKAEN